MSDCEYLHPEWIADIIFGKDHPHNNADIFKPDLRQKGRLSRLYSGVVNLIFPEPEKNNLGAAKEYLSSIGFKSWQIKHIENALHHAADEYLQRVWKDDQEGRIKLREVPLLKYSDRIHLGVRIGDDKDYTDEMFPDFAQSLRHSFIEQLNTLRLNKDLPRLLFAHPDKYPKGTEKPVAKSAAPA